MPNDLIAPISMQSAGVSQPPGDPESLIGLLRSQGSLPAEAMQMLQPPSVGQGYAAALSGGVSAMRGTADPVQQMQAQGARQQMWQGQQQMQQMQLLNQMQSQRAQQQMQQMNFLQKMQDREQKAAEKKYANYLEMSDMMLKAPEEATRQYGAKIRMAAWKEITGQEPPIGVFLGLAKQKITPEEVNAISLDFERFEPATVVQFHPDIPPAVLAEIQKARGGDVTRRILKLPTQQDEQRALLDLKIKEGDAALAGHPEMKGNANVIDAALILAQKEFKKPYLSLDPQQQMSVLESARAQVQAEEERKIRMQSQVSLDRAVALLDAKQSHATGKPLTPLQSQKLLEGPERARNTLDALEKLGGEIDKMDKLGALPKGESWAAQKAAQFNREVLLRGNPAVFQFKQMWSPISVGQIDRGLFDEKNVRFKAAFEQQTGVTDNMPPAAAMKSYLAAMKELIRGKAVGDVAEWEELGYPPLVIAAARRKLGLGGPQTLPQSPLTPPADLTYDPKTKIWGGR